MLPTQRNSWKKTQSSTACWICSRIFLMQQFNSCSPLQGLLSKLYPTIGRPSTWAPLITWPWWTWAGFTAPWGRIKRLKHGTSGKNLGWKTGFPPPPVQLVCAKEPPMPKSISACLGFTLFSPSIWNKIYFCLSGWFWGVLGEAAWA